MKILIYGDIVGRNARERICSLTPDLRKELSLDFVIADADNAAHGFGITPSIAEKFLETGIDVITTGNHIWNQKEIIPYFHNEPRILRALNFPEGTIGKGKNIFITPEGKRIAVVHLLGTLFMAPIDNPFRAIEAVFQEYILKKNVDAIIVDFHADITSEKNAFGQFCDGKVSAVLGTHSHIPTADARILFGGTAYITDIGMCGDYDSVIGMQKEEPIYRFLTGERRKHFEPATGKVQIHAVIVTIDEATGLACSIEKVIY